MAFDRYICGRFLLGALFLISSFTAPAVGQPGSVDPTFNAIPSNPIPTDFSVQVQQIVQPDGKILVYSASTIIVNGQAGSGIFRLNTDGSTDTTFAYNNEGGVGIDNIMLAPDGKIIVAGAASPNHAKMVRLNPDGSLDNTFSVFIAAVGPPDFTGNWLTVNAIQPDGKVIATHSSWGNIQGTFYSYAMRRYNLDGTVDSSFAAPTLPGGHLVQTSVLIEMLPDGRFYLGITSRSHLGGSLTLTRRLANGGVDPAFTAFTRSFSATSSLGISDLLATADGGVFISGRLIETLGNTEQLFKLLPTGVFDPGFVSPAVYAGSRIHVLPDGKILYASSASQTQTALRIIRLNSNGSLDNTYTMDPAVMAIVNGWVPDPAGRPIFLGQTSAGRRLVRLLENGSIDPGFNVQISVPSFVTALAVQTDGRVIVSGPFSSMNGVTRGRIARLNADGSLDSTFNPGTGFSANEPVQLAIQPDGKILASGGFSSYNGTPSPGIVRINADGSRDDTFAVNVTGGVVGAVAVQPDGKVMIGGSFASVDGVSRVRVARVSTTGALDPTFDAALTGGSVFRILVESSGKITIGGSFSGVAGTERNDLVRLESNGALDMSFDAGTVGTINLLLQQPDGKYVYTENSSRTVLRRNTNGTLDTGFLAPNFFHGQDNGSIQSVLLLPDGGMLVGGHFDRVGTLIRRSITRLRFNGSHDAAFMPNGAGGDVRTLASYPGGKVMMGGIFYWVDTEDRFGIARLNASIFQRTTPFDFDGDGRADISVVRPSTNRWYEVVSSTGQVYEETFGIAGDVLAPADFDGDGITDEGIYRPSNGQWWYRSSVNGGLVLNPFGGNGDIPRPSDFDGDGKADLVLFRPSNSTWYRYSSLTNSEATPVVFGLPGDQPLVGDFDGDGKSDIAIFRPSNGDWWYAASSAGGAFRNVHWGQNGDIPVPADYDGDGKTDYAIYRPSEGGWYIFNSSNGSFTTTAFGLASDRPVAADYDGDGRADIAVFRPSTGIWYLLRSTSGFAGYQFGISTDVAIPGSLIP